MFGLYFTISYKICNERQVEPRLMKAAYHVFYCIDPSADKANPTEHQPVVLCAFLSVQCLRNQHLMQI
jgi:hypothetical protein